MTKSNRAQRARHWSGELGLAICSCSDAPDLTPMYEAAKASAKLGEEALAWYKEQAAAQAPLIQRAADRADEVAGKQIQMMDQNMQLSSDYDKYRKETFVPVEKKLVSDAMTFNTDQERERMAGQAGGDVAQAFGSARSQLQRQAASSGIDPNDGAFAAGLTGLAGQEALQNSYLKNKTRQDSKTLGRAMLMDAASLGRGLPSQQATSAQIALSAGNSGVQNSQVPIQLSTNNTMLGGQGYGTAMQGYGQAGNLYGQAAKIEYGDGGAGLAQAGGAAVGGIAMAI